MAGSRSRVLNFVLAADARQVQRAFTQAEKAGDRYAKSAEHTHARANRSFAQSAKSAAKWAGGVTAAYVSISKAHDAITATEDLGKATAGLHRNLGLSVKEASRWAGVAHARGIDNKALTMSFTTLSRQVEAANSGSTKQQKIFASLGLTQADLKRGTHDFSGLVTQLADGFGKLHGGTKRQAAAQALLGRGYQSILPLFAEGSKSLKEQLHWADQYGVTLDKKTLQPIEKLTKAQRELKIANLGLKVAFTKETAPALLKVEGAALKVLRVMNDPRLTSEQKWKKIGDIVGPIANKIGQGVTSAIPKIAEGVGHHAPQVASAFIKGFMKADAWGKLVIAGWLLHKFGGLKAFGALGRLGGGALGGGVAEGAVASGALGPKTFGGKLGARLRPGLISAGKFAGGILGTYIALNALDEMRKHGLGSGLTHLLFPLAPGTQPNQFPKPGIPKGYTRVPSDRPGALAFNDGRGGTVYAMPGPGPGRGAGGTGGRAAGALSDGPKQFKELAKGAAAAERAMAHLDKESGDRIKNISKNLGLHSARGRKALEANFGAAVGSVATAMRKGTVTTDQGMSEIRNLMRIHSKGGATVIDKNFRTAVNAIQDGMDSGRVHTKTGMGAIRSLMSDLSKKGASAVERNMPTFVRAIHDAMRSGKLTTRDGMTYILKAFEKTSSAFGIGGTLGTAAGWLAASLPKKARGGRAEAGGWIGQPGERGQDQIPIVVGAGEAVLNRHQQAPVENALRMVYGMGLDDLFSRVQRPHYMAKGGRPNWGGHPPLSGGIAQAVGAIQGAYPELRVTATTDHSYRTSTGNVSDHSKGWAADVAASPGVMFMASRWVKTSGLAQSLKQGIHNPNLAIDHGRDVGAGFFGAQTWAEHLSHIHLAVQGALGAIAGGAAYKPIKRVVVRGPNSPMKRIVQAALDKARNAANKKLKALAAQQAAAAGGGGLGGVTGVPANPRMRSWAVSLLQNLGIAPSPGAVQSITRWELAEGGHWNNSARYNPLNTTMNAPGAHSINSVGVKAYTSWAQGLSATVATLRNYRGILAALRSGNYSQFRSAVYSSSWGTKSGPREGRPGRPATLRPRRVRGALRAGWLRERRDDTDHEPPLEPVHERLRVRHREHLQGVAAPLAGAPPAGADADGPGRGHEGADPDSQHQPAERPHGDAHGEGVGGDPAAVSPAAGGRGAGHARRGHTRQGIHPHDPRPRRPARGHDRECRLRHRRRRVGLLAPAADLRPVDRGHDHPGGAPTSLRRGHDAGRHEAGRAPRPLPQAQADPPRGRALQEADRAAAEGAQAQGPHDGRA
jgi:hypothetical protein